MPIMESNVEPKTAAEIDAAITANRKATQKLHMQKRQIQAKEAREKARGAMKPDEIAADQSYDALYNKVFGNADGLEVLKHLEQTRPVVADMIKERLTRADPNYGKAAPEGAANDAATGPIA